MFIYKSCHLLVIINEPQGVAEGGRRVTNVLTEYLSQRSHRPYVQYIPELVYHNESCFDLLVVMTDIGSDE